MNYGKINVIRTGEKGVDFHQGSFCSVAENVKAYLGGHHRTDYVTTFPFGSICSDIFGNTRYGHPARRGNIIIWNDVWIGDDVKIMSNIVIGNGAVLGSSSVVTKDVDDYAIVAGNPARFIRYRFPEHVRKELTDIAWWDEPIETIKKLVPFLMNENVEYNLPRIREIIEQEKKI
jgi:acetyltransferase-like isoleucine patch superfamily enzyme